MTLHITLFQLKMTLNIKLFLSLVPQLKEQSPVLQSLIDFRLAEKLTEFAFDRLAEGVLVPADENGCTCF